MALNVHWETHRPTMGGALVGLGTVQASRMNKEAQGRFLVTVAVCYASDLVRHDGLSKLHDIDQRQACFVNVLITPIANIDNQMICILT